jgi:hypothetical protein
MGVLAMIACGGQARPVPADAPTSLPTPKRNDACRRFEKTLVDMGIERASALVLGLKETCAIADGSLVCLHRAVGAKPLVKISDVARAAAGWSPHICAQHTNGAFECFGDKPYDLGYFEKQDAGWSKSARTIALAEDELHILGPDGAMRAMKLQVGTNARSEMIWFATPKPALKEKVDAVTIVHELGGTLTCVLVGKREICRTWRIDQPMAMPAPVAAIGGHCALLEDKSVACFAIHQAAITEPAVIATLPNARTLASDDGPGGCAVNDDGRVTCFGDLGIVYSVNGIGPFPVPTPIALPGPAEEIAMSDGRACARTKDGRVMCFGCLALSAP